MQKERSLYSNAFFQGVLLYYVLWYLIVGTNEVKTKTHRPGHWVECNVINHRATATYRTLLLCVHSNITHSSTVFVAKQTWLAFKGYNTNACVLIYLSLLQVLLRIFSFLSHREILKYAVVCKKWHLISQDSRLWGFVSLRPEISGLHVQNEGHMLQLISTKFGNNLRYLELNAEMVTPNVLVDLAKKCANLTHLLLDFAQASQLHDFTDLGAFPTKLKFMTLYLSDTIFLDNFMKRIYRYIFSRYNEGFVIKSWFQFHQWSGDAKHCWHLWESRNGGGWNLWSGQYQNFKASNA